VRLLSSLAILISLLVAGCDSVPNRVSERFTPAPAQERGIASPRPAVYAATVTALKRMGLTVARAAEAQGEVLARTQIVRDEAFREVLQYEFEVRVREYGEGETKVSAWVREHVEGGLTTGGVSIQSLRSHGLYDSFFATLEQVLAEPPEAQP